MRIDYSGVRYNKLVGMEFVENNKNGHALWRFGCDCGNEVVAFATNVKTGKTQSCGCHRIEARIRHNGSFDPTYDVWAQMRYRCSNPDHPGYKWYGAKGVTVCPEWESYATFMKDMGPRPGGLTIDRINPYGNYEPSNCRWATWQEQAWNKRRHWDKKHAAALDGDA